MFIMVIRNFGRLLDLILIRYVLLVFEIFVWFVFILLVKLCDCNLINFYEFFKNELINLFN